MKKVNGQETSDDVPHVGASYTVVETTKTFNPLPGTIVRIGGIDGKLLTVYCAADPSIEYKVPIRTFERCCSQGRTVGCLMRLKKNKGIFLVFLQGISLFPYYSK